MPGAGPDPAEPLLAQPEPVAAPPAPEALALARAWQLKQQCYASWTSDPPRAADAAAALAVLAADWPAQPVVQALARWTAGVVCLNQGRMADAVAALDAAAAIFQAQGQALEAAQTQVPKVMALSMLGRHDDAAACGAAAQQAFIAQHDLAAASRIGLNLGSLHMRRDAYAEAARQYRQAAVLFARARDAEHSVMADIGLGDALAAQAEFDEAARIYSRARMRASQHALPLMQALAEESMALLELARGRFDGALSGLELARRGYVRLGLPQHSAIAEKQLADAYLALHLLPEALALYERALASMAALDMPDDRAWAELQRGRALVGLGQLGQAADAFEAAAAQFAAQRSPSGEVAVALAQAELALALEGQSAATGPAGPAAAAAPAAPGTAPDADDDGPLHGDWPAASSAFDTDTLPFTRSAPAPDAASLAARAAEAALAAGLPESATRARLLQAAARLRAGAAGEARVLYARVLRRAQALKARGLQIRAQAGLGLAALAEGDAGAAARALRAAVDRFEAQWRALPGDELRGAFLADHLAAYQGLLALALQAHAADPGPATAALVLQRLDAVRARALALRLEQAAGRADDPVAERLRARVQWLHRRQARQAEESGRASATLAESLHQAERALLEHLRRQRLAQPVAQARAARPLALLPALQALLAPGDAVVVLGSQGDELFACLVSGPAQPGGRPGVQLLRQLASLAEVQQAWAQVRFQLDALRHGVQPVQAHLAMLAQRAQGRLRVLHDLLWAPMAELLADANRVLLVPGDGLAGLPFAALHDGLTCVAQRHQLALAPSVQVALHCLQRRPVKPRQVLAVGESSRLPHAGAEAQRVAALFPGAQALLGSDATVAAVQARSGEADLLHLACHAQFRGDNPQFSALHLADGPLSAERAESLALKPGIVVLSACDTARAGSSGAEEQVGLVRAFLVAGAARVVASQWPVDDAVTAAFMAVFYPALLAGRPPAAALAEAQMALMRQHPHPAFWAGFVLFGGW